MKRPILKRAILGRFRKTLSKKLRFFGERSPFKIIYIGAKGGFRKFSGSLINNEYLKVVQMRESLGHQGVESLREEGVRNPPSPTRQIRRSRFFLNKAR